MNTYITRRVSRLALHTSRLTRYALLLFPLLFLALFYFYPLTAIFGASFAGSAWADITARLFSTTTLRVLGFTLGQATLSTALTLLLGLPGAYVFARYEFPGKALLQALATVPF
ncbi:MAG TPA: iron ABC transporter permease, partial [Anaerolineae bacterium]|nr:iron ABC transporter permease [Anaerolineae bacterium]